MKERVFSRLTVTGLESRNKYRNYWLCRCECGGEKVVREDNLLRGNTKSCGCLQKENKRSKIRKEDAVEIRSASKEYTRRRFSEIFKLSKSAINHVLKNRTWKIKEE